ncbi:acetyl-CoA carboxylase biotin carboxyl carrier protein [Desmospora activa]|nr:acetyl-CoA carboxylase biotin carboxyl carrier protein [Desmospora activa]
MHEIRELIRLVDESQVEEFELDNDGTKIVIKKKGERLAESAIQVVQKPAPALEPVSAPAVAPVPAPVQTPNEPAIEQVEDEAGLHPIVSPMVGTFYRAPSPDASPYVDKGSRVEEKSVVCIVEAMKLMNEIEAEVKGEVVKILVENGQLVEYGQPLFLVKPD